MFATNAKLHPLLLLLIDGFLLAIAFTIAYILRVQLNNKPLATEVGALEFFYAFMLIIPVWLIIFASLGLYNAAVYNARLKEWARLALGTFMGILLVIGFEYFTSAHIFPAKLVVVYTLIFSFLLVLLEREILRVARSLLFQFGIGISRVMIIGNSHATRDIAANLANTRRSGYKVVAVAGPRSIIPKGLTVQHFSRVEAALKEVKALRISTIIQTDLYDSGDRNQLILGAAQTNHITYSFIPGEPEFYTGKHTTDVFLGYPMISVSQTPLIGWGAIAKSIFDRIAALLLITVLSPLYLLIIVLQKLLNPGPVFYTSKRLSRFSQPISLIKFRSMGAAYGAKDAAEEFVAMGRPDLAKEYKKRHKVTDDPRITRFGKLLRDTSLDELPQLFNVLRGDLSLVGPRPILPQEATFSPARTALLHSVKSGVTGLWQVSGRSELSFEERIELELYYAQNWSFWLDMKILLKTISVVIRRQGAR